MSVHDHGVDRQRRHTFNRDPATYRLARPPYPRAVYEILTAECGLVPGSRVLEIGPGTGQATAELLARGASVVAVEPGAGLAELLVEQLGGETLEVIRSDIEDARLPPEPFDLAVSATAFHWIDTAVALPRIAAALRLDGCLAVWWTVFGDTDRPTEFRSRLFRIYDDILPGERHWDVPGPLRTESWTRELQRDGWFGPATVDLIRWSQRITAESARLLWSTFPNINELDADRRAAFLARLGRLVDDLGGTVDDPRVTAVYRTRRRQ